MDAGVFTALWANQGLAAARSDRSGTISSSGGSTGDDWTVA